MITLAARPINRSLHRWPVMLWSITALLAVTWYRSLIDMWGRWYPMWHQTQLSFMDRLVEGDSYYTHGPLAAIASAVVAWSIHRRIGCPVQRMRSSSIVGGMMLVASPQVKP